MGNQKINVKVAIHQITESLKYQQAVVFVNKRTTIIVIFKNASIVIIYGLFYYRKLNYGFSQTCIGEINENCISCEAELFWVLNSNPIGQCKCDKGYYEISN